MPEVPTAMSVKARGNMVIQESTFLPLNCENGFCFYKNIQESKPSVA